MGVATLDEHPAEVARAHTNIEDLSIFGDVQTSLIFRNTDGVNDLWELTEVDDLEHLFVDIRIDLVIPLSHLLDFAGHVLEPFGHLDGLLLHFILRFHYLFLSIFLCLRRRR